MKAATISTTGNGAAAWHALAADDVVRRLDTNTRTGLAAAEIPQRLAKYGPNRLPEAARRGPFLRFLLQFRANAHDSTSCLIPATCGDLPCRQPFP